MVYPEWETAKHTDTKGKNEYLVALECGGVMEDPDIHYEDFQIIKADSADEARQKYDELNHCEYYYGSVLAVRPIKNERRMNMSQKTKAMLLEEIEQKNQEIKDLEKEVKKLEKYKVYEDMATEMRAIHQSFVNAGFDDDQAMDLLKSSLNIGVRMAMPGIKF